MSICLSTEASSSYTTARPVSVHDLNSSPFCAYISDDSEFLYVGGLRVQQLPYRLLLVELSPCQRLHTHTDHVIKHNILIPTFSLIVPVL